MIRAIIATAVWLLTLTSPSLADASSGDIFGPSMSIDAPAAGTHAQKVWLTGWAIDTDASSGTGVSTVHVWAYPNPGSGQAPIPLGAATYGIARPDVDGAHGGTGRYTDSGWSLLVHGLAPGLYNVHAYAYSTATGTFNQERVVTVTLTANPFMAVDTPQVLAHQPFNVAGWAIDFAAASGTGVNTVHVWARRLDGGSDQFMGAASYGSSRTDVGAAYGAQFDNSGYTLNISGLSAGVYRFTVYAYSLVANSFNQAVQFDVQVDPVVATPVLTVPSGTYTSDFSVSASTSTPDATLRYTTDGSEPSSSSAVFPSSYFVNGTVTLKVRGFRTGWTPSATTTGSYVLQVGTPTASHSAGTYPAGQVVTLTPAGPFDTIRYTTDGSAVTESSPAYHQVNPVVLNGPTVLRARGYRAPYSPSAELVVSYVVGVALPTMSPEGGQYQTLPVVTVTTSTSGATIRYTTDRTDPTESSPVYTGPITTQNFTSIRARAYKAGWAPSSVAVATYWDFTPPETSGVSAVVSGLNPQVPAAVGGTVAFAVSGGTMTTDPDSVFVYRNGARLTGAALQISASGITLPNVLLDGENRLELEALDQAGLVFYDAATVWAGSRTLTVTVRRRQGATAVSGAAVVARLQRAGAVSASGTTNGAGQLTVSSLPAAHEVALVVTAPGFRAAEVTTSAMATGVTVDLDEATLDFGTLAGWNVQTSRAWTQPHTEGSTPLVPCGDCLGHGGSFDPHQSVATAGDGPSNLDLVMDTKNLYGAQTVTRTLVVAPGTSQVTARFRFQTDEIWSALPGRAYFPHHDDWFLVRMQPVGRPSEAVTYTQTVSQLLNAGQLNGHAATPWYALSLPTQFTDAVEVTFTVANAVTNGHLSILYADVVQETTHRIAAVELRDLIDPNDPYQADREDKVLSALSLSTMPAGLVSYEGHIRVNGMLRIEGPPTDSLTDVWLEVWDNGVKIATAPLARSTSSAVRSQLLNVPFGADGLLEVVEVSPGIAPVLFEFVAGSLATVNQLADSSTLVLQIHAKRSSGAELAVFTVKDEIPKLVVYPSATVGRSGNNRDLGDCAGLTVTSRPEQRYRRHNPPFPCGGDSWALPSTIVWAQENRVVPFEGGNVSIGWNDFSNMNGGFFAGHSGHRDGRTIDGIFAGYTNLDARTAQILLAWLDDMDDVSKVDRIYVGFSTNATCTAVAPIDPSTNRFYQELVGKQLADGRQATAVIRNQVMHCDHFDIRLRPIVQ